MADIAVINFPEAQPLDEKVTVPQEILNLKVDQGLLHEAMRYYRARQRQGTHSTKTRSEVRGGGHKPWKQKHTGRARAGSNRSPLWRKGGITFGPHPRDHSLAYPAKKRALVLDHALASKFPDSIRFVKEENLVQVSKTRELARFCQQLKSTSSILVVTSGNNGNLSRASSNLRHVRTKRAQDLSGYDVLASSVCVFGDKAWKEIVEFRYGGV